MEDVVTFVFVDIVVVFVAVVFLFVTTIVEFESICERRILDALGFIVPRF